MHFWAKTTSEDQPGISVYAHMINVGAVALAIAESMPLLLERLQIEPNTIAALAAMHDIGKISPGFQRKCAAWISENHLEQADQRNNWEAAPRDHGLVSHETIHNFLLDKGYPRQSVKFFSAVIGAHHGRTKLQPPRNRFQPDSFTRTGGIDWGDERSGSAEKVCEYFGMTSLPEMQDGKDPVPWWIGGLTSVADWIGSNEQFFSSAADDRPYNPLEMARSALRTIGFTPPEIVRGLSFDTIFGFSPNEMQRKTLASITSPGVYIIEAPMGMGKTEAALGAAYTLLQAGQATGIYFALPTQATSNRIHLRFNKYLDSIAPKAGVSRLIHGNSWLLREQLDVTPSMSGTDREALLDARMGRDWFASPKRALLAPFGVGTIDQALLGVLAVKHFFVRRFALAGKVVILDEIHSYDVYTGTLVNELISTLEALGCTVIILSATLSSRRRAEIFANSSPSPLLQEYPLITGRSKGHIMEPVAASPPPEKTVSITWCTNVQAATEAVELAQKGGSILWICDTVASAQNTYADLSEIAPTGVSLGLLHSRFTQWRREQLENEWMEAFGKDGSSRCGAILVSTQIVEQSVDLDADLLITELAPSDMLLQRLGRLWRHERPNRPVKSARVLILEENASLEELHIQSQSQIQTNLGAKAMVYAPYVLLRTLELWRSYESIVLPTHIRSIIEETYRERDNEPEAWQHLFVELTGRQGALRQHALTSSNIWQPQLTDNENVQTRYSEMVTFPLVLLRALTDREAHFVDGTRHEVRGKTFLFDTAKAVHRSQVSIPVTCIEIRDLPISFEAYISEPHAVGFVADDGMVSLSGLKSDRLMRYTDELGLVITRLS